MRRNIVSELSAGEKILFRAKPSIWVLAFPLISSLIVFLVAVFYLTPLIIVAIVSALSGSACYFGTEIAVTNRRIILMQGIPSKTRDMKVMNVEVTEVNQSLIGSWLNFGDVILAGSGRFSINLVGIHNPTLFRKKLNKLQTHLENKKT